MSKYPAISMDSVREKLRNLKQYMPDAPHDIVYEFGAFLAGRLNQQLVPEGFNMACELALYDLEAGVDGFSRKPISGGLAGYPPMIYAALRLSIPQIAEATCPEDFAKGVKEVRDEVNKILKEKKD